MKSELFKQDYGREKGKTGRKKEEKKKQSKEEMELAGGLKRKLELGVTRIMVEDTHEAETHGLKWEFE